MKILSLHCDYIKFKPLKKALKHPEEISVAQKKEKSVKEALVIFTAVEKTDADDTNRIVKLLVENIEDIAGQIKAQNIVLYPYAHLSSNLAAPEIAIEIMKLAEKLLKKSKKNFDVVRAPFGYYKEFELKVKGHPLSELSREISVEGVKKEKREEMRESLEEEKYNYKNLLREVSKAKLDRSKLKDNDHRILGQQMELFSFNNVAPGMVFWHANGLIIYNELIKFMRQELKKEGYKEIRTPEILDKKLWLISGHWEKYRENIFLTKYEGRDFASKPMNCPGGLLVYKTKPRSYKDFPMRVAEFGLVHRQELSGVLGGIFRVIEFTQDDAHIFCNEKQLGSEILKIIRFIKKVYRKFKFSYTIELSTRPKKRIGSEKIWDKAEKTFANVLKKNKIEYKVIEGEGVFYGPKIDFHIKDSLGRTWQCGTIQLDFSMPERFNLEYTNKDNKRKRPVMLHRAIFGSLERFIGVLLEHTNGRLPTWLAPVQLRILSFTDRNKKDAGKIAGQLEKSIPGLRIDTDFRTESVGLKVKDAEVMKIPYIVVIGDKEQKAKNLAVRVKGSKKIKSMKPDAFIKQIKKEIEDRF